jgi:hypothetical protein
MTDLSVTSRRLHELQAPYADPMRTDSPNGAVPPQATKKPVPLLADATHFVAPPTDGIGLAKLFARTPGCAPAPLAPEAIKNDGKLYTSNPGERTTTRTRVDLKGDVLPALERAWPESTPAMRKVMAAQIGIETTGGEDVYNFNVGNKKAGSNEPHMYLRGTWEIVSQKQADAELVGPQGHLVHVKDVRADGKVHVIFDPPHPQARFKAIGSLDEGLRSHVEYYKKLAAEDPAFKKALEDGDTDTVAHILKVRGYYSGDEEAYKKGMRLHGAKL